MKTTVIRDDLEIGRKTKDLLVRVLALQQLGTIDTGYGKKGELAEKLGCDVRALDRALVALADAKSEVEQLIKKIQS
jgi:tRNA A-37 threonylcarbamoyl transferase component Bud32